MTGLNANRLSRLFKIGAARSVETEAMSNLSDDEVRDLLNTGIPEVANAAVRERDENGLRVEFLPQPGRKG